ncbi:MAG TPA: type II toxin-antitoxin system VapC family toxin [Phototrophicaceae bacterium]|nr:type II toxin-antitoxin system VapC family toxin [Phototrophicaceae bacterium]
MLTSTPEIFLLDTNAMIARLNGDEALSKILAKAEVVVSSTVVGELYFGAYKSKRVEENIQNIETFIQGRTVLNCDVITARWYGQIYHQLRVKGRPIPPNDVWIAAMAVQHNLTLLTKDEHFKEVDNLRLKSW